MHLHVHICNLNLSTEIFGGFSISLLVFEADSKCVDAVDRVWRA